MKVIIIGAGRMGSALAARSAARGHLTRVLCRSLRSKTLRPLPSGARLEEIGSTSPRDVDLVLIAAPAWAEHAKEALVSSFLGGLGDEVPVCSAVAYTGAPNALWAAGRPFARIMCSAAVASGHQKSVVLFHGNGTKVRRTFAKWLGPAHLRITSSRSFERLGSIFIATAIHCETLRRIGQSLTPPISNAEKRFSADTLLEAYALLETFRFDLDAAFAACLTPHGQTLSVAQRLLREVPSSLPETANAQRRGSWTA